MNLDADFKYYAVMSLLLELLRRGYTLERAIAYISAGRWPGVGDTLPRPQPQIRSKS